MVFVLIYFHSQNKNYLVCHQPGIKEPGLGHAAANSKQQALEQGAYGTQETCIMDSPITLAWWQWG